mgnify:CR=1 FL=1
MRSVIKEACERKYDEMEAKLQDYCRQILNEAIINRYNNVDGHNYTGNLIGSIAVGLWRRGVLVRGFLSADELPDATMWKMTSPGVYVFDKDWEGDKSFYRATVKTDKGYGKYDAGSFLAHYRAAKKYVFEIVVAYTTEYAKSVEKKRGTTGYAATVTWVELTAGNAAQ